MDYNAEYERLLQEERDLTLKSFSRASALKVGLFIMERMKKDARPFGVDVFLSGLLVFRYYPEGITRNNEMWLRRKYNAVMLEEMSSLRLTVRALRDGKTYEDMLFDKNIYAWGGGGFPVRVEGTGVVGAVCVSGLPDREDHGIIVEALMELKKAQG